MQIGFAQFRRTKTQRNQKHLQVNKQKTLVLFASYSLLLKYDLFFRLDDSFISLAYQMLIVQLKKEHSEIRYSALQLVDCLFQRSHTFRELLLDELNSFFEYILETNVDKPLPAPVKKAAELKKLAIRIIQQWHDKFHGDYKLLELGYNYLKNIKKV